MKLNKNINMWGYHTIKDIEEMVKYANGVRIVDVTRENGWIVIHLGGQLPRIIDVRIKIRNF